MSGPGALWELGQDAASAWLALAKALEVSGPTPCEAADARLWFPEGNGQRLASQAAREACGGCLARAECLAFALAADERHGIWGGLDVDERRELRRQGRAA
ncbi:transcription factor WhiB [Motilibacter peucedani]|uniref:Transcriptional regulator WhiB n=1 Tax=Motilibacter peucedani TaxID=598650 RepID=A0A420XS00_9ACTN|nr:WhiB family transcriptional regulator [Motilibacter peucedani]RKS77589.1 transcription factor WhiB [Motilibacter peucedani]